MGLWGILLAVLKIIGVIVLGLFLFLLFLVCILLLVPFVYKFKLEKYNDIAAEGKVGWLFGLIAVYVEYRGGKPVIKVLLAGRDIEKLFQKKKKKKQKKKGKQKKQKKKTAKPAEERTLNVPDELSKNEKEESIKRHTDTVKSIEVPPEVEEPKVSRQGTIEDDNKVSPMYRRVPMKRMVLEESKIEEKAEIEEEPDLEKVSEEEEIPKDKADASSEEGKNSKKKGLDTDYFIHMPLEEKKAVIKAVMIFIKETFGNVLPDKVYVDITVGTGDPATTGYLLAGAGVLKGYKFKNLNVRGKFDDLFFEGEIGVEGRIVFVTFLVSALRFVLKKPIRRIIIKLWKGRGE